jgi:acid phosphatase
MQSPTGYKEAFDLGYQLRTRYPGLYNEGDEFYVWSNNYTRVLQTATNFVNGFLGSEHARTLGKIVSVTSKIFPEAVGNSLGPSDMCPNFQDASGGDQKATWDDLWLPGLQQRLQKLIQGSLVLTRSDCESMAYLCGFESQITGKISPFCDVLTDYELSNYGYSNDLRYYYGVGPGTELPPKLMTPFLNNLMGIFQQGPGIEGVAADGVSKFKVPKLMMAFLNDGQLTELQSAIGVFDEEPPLDPSRRNPHRLWNGSRFVTMRGTVAFERLTCNDTSYVRVLLNDQVYPVAKCQEGPGRSCPLHRYVDLTRDRFQRQGNWMQNCNVTMKGVSENAKGSTFFTDLSQPHLKVLSA